jgi:hypothetical protein
MQTLLSDYMGYLVVKSEYLKYFKRLGVVLSILLLTSVSVPLLNQPENSGGQEQQEVEEEQNATTADVNFGYPLNTTINLGTPFLVQYDNTTSVSAIGNASLDNFIVTFAGHGILNGTIRYNDNGTGTFITNPVDGTVFQKGVIELRIKNGNDSIKTTYESLGIPIRQQNPDRHLLLDSGVMFFNTSSVNDGKLSFLNNKVAVYKDLLDRDMLNLTTIAWEWN